VLIVAGGAFGALDRILAIDVLMFVEFIRFGVGWRG
jgi:hypothetical protein